MKLSKLEFAKLVVAHDEADRHAKRLAVQYRSIRALEPKPLEVRHSYVNDGGDASRRGVIDIQVTENEVWTLLEVRMRAADKAVEALAAQIADAEADQ